MHLPSSSKSDAMHLVQRPVAMSVVKHFEFGFAGVHLPVIFETKKPLAQVVHIFSTNLRQNGSTIELFLLERTQVVPNISYPL